MEQELKKELRGSHFQLGSTNQTNQFVSTMKMNYAKGDVEMRKPVELNLRGSHFSLGVNPTTSYATTNKTHFQGKQMPPVTLNQEQKNELRNNHFQLGHQDGAMVSVSRAVHDPKPVQPNVQFEQEKQKAKMRAHHHNFAESAHQTMHSTYKREYNGNFGKQDINYDHSTDTANLRAHHFIMGQEQPKYISNTHDVHRPFKGEIAKFNHRLAKDLQQNHFSLN